LLFIGKDRVHQFNKLLNYKGQIIVFTDELFIEAKLLRKSILFNDLNNIPTINLTKDEFQIFDLICNQIKNEININFDSLQHNIIKNHLHNFLLLAEREKRKQGFIEFKKTADFDYVILFRELLEANYTKLKTVKEYASLLFISEKRLGQATTKVLGKSPKVIINERIVLESKRLLANTKESVKEIGYSLGFEEPTNFIKFFKNITGLTPLEFRILFYLD